MSVINGHKWALTANPRVRTALFLFGVSLTGSTLWSVFAGPLGFLLLMISLLIVAVSLIAVLSGVVSALFGRQWRLFGERLIVLVVAAPVVVTGTRLGDYVHLALLYPYYRENIAQTSKRPVRFYWGDQAVSVLDGLQLRSLLYDDTGVTTVTTTQERDDQGLCTFRQHLMVNFFIESLHSC